MIDAADRPVPRFPSDHEPTVQQAIGAVLRDWGIGPGDLCLSGGARGGDVLFAETCLALGARVRLLLPMSVEAFVKRSVEGEGDWERRFRALLDLADVRTQDDGINVGPAESPFVQGNTELLIAAQVAAAPGIPSVLLLWDGHLGDGDGGTADVAARVRELGWPMTIVDPTQP
jgi:hypothetical protein